MNFDEGFTDILASAQKALSKPGFILALAISVAILWTHMDNLDNGPLAVLFPADSDNFFIQTVRQNEGKLLGFVVFLPFLMDVPSEFKLYFLMYIAAWITFIPTCPIWQYTIQVSALYLYFHVTTKSARVLILVALAIAIWFGFVTIPSTVKWGPVCQKQGDCTATPKTPSCCLFSNSTSGSKPVYKCKSVACPGEKPGS